MIDVVRFQLFIAFVRPEVIFAAGEAKQMIW
jgi:hypothetical protein